MADKKFDPKKFIDREFEAELFENLLKLNDEKRILTIQDVGGMGKTQLLQKLEYRCSTVKPRTPVSFVDLEALNPTTLVMRITEDLKKFGLEFPNFKKHDAARTGGDFSVFLSSVHLQGSDLKGASDVRAAGYMVNIDQHSGPLNITGGGVGKLLPDQEEKAQEVCIEVFFDELEEHCENRPIILLFDRYERAGNELIAWLAGDLFPLRFFDFNKRPKKLILVLAGREIPDFTKDWPQEDVDAVVESVKELSKWKKEHVEECLRIHGFKYERKDLDAFYHLIKSGLPPSEVVRSIELIMEKRRAET
ncbi:MAG: hypothetical protein ACFFCW_00035 [Candidatus Hodarchaeota archaeon]